jgi:peptidoglycan/LPS O-acetylase OafA/YrhL
MPQLDSLRAFSVFAVIYCHYVPADYWPFGVNLAPLGVRCFFVLSGFLITSILLRDFTATPSFKAVYPAFIARRALRLYPILLVVLLVTALLDVPRTRETLVWNMLYLTNFYMATLQTWPEAIGHLWSLAVEEQFYLFWPLVLFAVPRRYLPPIIVALVLIAPLFRLLWRVFDLSFVGAEVLTPTAFDALGLGALLALYRHDRVLIGTIGAAGAVGWLLTTALWTYGILPGQWGTLMYFVSQTAAAMVFVWVVQRLADGVPGIAGKIIGFPVFVYLGTISYGIYILHQFSPYLLGRVPISLPVGQYYAVCVIITVGLAALSWHLLELPIMRAGRRWLRKERGGRAPVSVQTERAAIR